MSIKKYHLPNRKVSLQNGCTDTFWIGIVASCRDVEGSVVSADAHLGTFALEDAVPGVRCRNPGYRCIAPAVIIKLSIDYGWIELEECLIQIVHLLRL